MLKQLVSVTFSVRDLDRACDFYASMLGLKLAYRNKKTGWAEFDLGPARLALQQREPYGGGANPLVTIRVTNIDRTVATLKQRGVAFENNGVIHDDFFGRWVHCKDIDGNVLNLFEPPN